MENKRFVGMMFAMIIGVVLLSMTFITQTQIFALMSDRYYRYDDRTERLYSSNYEDESLAQDLAFIRPQIPSMILHSPVELKLFIPLPERESRKLFAACSAEEPKMEFSSDKMDASRQAFRDYRKTCYTEQLEILIDGAALDYILKSYSHPHQQEFGLLLFFPGLSLEPGEHQLEIRHLAVINDGKIKTDRIPFFYLPDE